jgi:hypothetical protein
MNTFMNKESSGLQPIHIHAEIRHVELGEAIVKKPRHPSPILAPKPIRTKTPVAMDYFSVRGIESQTSYLQYQWPLFITKELMDNSYDWFNECYRNNPKSDRKIMLRVCPIDIGTRIAVRNSNIDNLPVFDDLKSTFDFRLWDSTKRNQHKDGTGALGDALKRSLGMGYAKWTENREDNKDSFQEIQWDEPIILRFNRKEYTALLRVDKENLDPQVLINENYDAVIDNTDTEVSVALPLSANSNSDYSKETIYSQIIRYYKIYKIPKIRTEISIVVPGMQ